MSEQAGRYQRSAAGMIGALLILLAVVGAYVAFRAVNRTEPEPPVRTVDYEQSVTFAREQTDLPLLAPEKLPDGWRATSVELTPEPVRWHLGLLTDEDKYVGLEQSRGSEESMVETYVDAGAVPGDDVEVAGSTWSTWTDQDGDTALVREEQDMTTLVVGTAGQEVLVGFVEQLSDGGTGAG